MHHRSQRSEARKKEESHRRDRIPRFPVRKVVEYKAQPLGNTTFIRFLKTLRCRETGAIRLAEDCDLALQLKQHLAFCVIISISVFFECKRFNV